MLMKGPLDHKEGTMVVLGTETNKGIMAEVEAATRTELMKPQCVGNWMLVISRL